MHIHQGEKLCHVPLDFEFSYIEAKLNVVKSKKKHVQNVYRPKRTDVCVDDLLGRLTSSSKACLQ